MEISESSSGPKPDYSECEVALDLQNGDVTVLGLISPVKRQYKLLDIMAVGYNICSSWLGFSVSIALALQAGGSVTLLYGTIFICFIYFCVGLTLAELASVYPTAGGQYHFASILAPKQWSREISYTCGLLSIFAWIIMVSSVTFLTGQMMLSIIANFDDSYTSQSYYLFFVVILWTGLTALYNLFLIKSTTWIYDICFIFSLAMFFIVAVTCPARSRGHPSSKQVWTETINTTGWPSGISFLIGTLTPQYMFGGLDGALHLAEECLKPNLVVPLAIMSTVSIGSLTGLTIGISMAYSITDLEAVLGTPTGFPLYEIYILATRSEVAATVFLGSAITIGQIAMIATQQTASRMTWALARDNALWGSEYLSQIHPTRQAPTYALLFNWVAVCLISFLILASSTAFNAVIGSGSMLSLISFAIPAVLLIYRRMTVKDPLPKDRSFCLPSALGYFVNIVLVLWTLVSTVIFCLPSTLPVSWASMNYACVVLFVIAVFGLLNWVFYACKHYQAPRIGFDD